MTAPVTFAFGAGLLATCNRCGVVMLPSLLGLGLTADGEHDRAPVSARCACALSAGLVFSATFSAVLVLAGLALAAGLRWLVSAIPWLAVTVGASLVVAGAAMLAGRHFGATWLSGLQPTRTRRTGYGRVAMFGVGYAIASLSCTVAVVLSVAGQSTATGDPVQVLAVWGAFAAGATSALVALSLSLALATGIVTRAMRRIAPSLTTIAAVMLAASGAYLIVYWLPTLLGGDNDDPGGPVAGTTDEVSSTVANFLAAHTGAFAIGLAVVLVAGAGLAAARRSRRPALTSRRLEGQDSPVQSISEDPA